MRISFCHGQMPNASGFGHGMCQKRATLASGRFFLDQPREEGEMVVLDEDQRGFLAGDLLQQGLRELLVHLLVLQIQSSRRNDRAGYG